MCGDLGFIYLLSNPVLSGIVKIGYTKKNDAEIRATELSSSTAIPLPFEVENSWLVENPSRWEARIHAQLAFCRISRDREFFKIDIAEAEQHINLLLYGTDDPIEAAVRGIRNIVTLYRQYPKSFKYAENFVAKIERILDEKLHT